MIAMNSGLLRKPLLWQTVCVLLSLLALSYPVYVIRPFRYQSSLELNLALAVVRFRPYLDILLVVASLVLLLFSWRQSRSVRRKVSAAVCALLVVLFGILSRLNVYEFMFHPLDRPSFSLASKAKLDGGEEVIAVHIAQAARAYPIRSMSYHHIVNDVVGGYRIVATY